MRKKRNPGAPRHASVSKEKGNGPAACDHIYTYMVCAYMYICVCLCALCPVKYEHAGVKPAIDRRKRREKEVVRIAARVKACAASPFEGELQESALSTPESSYVPSVPTVFLDGPVSIYLSCTLFFLFFSHLRESPTSLCNCFCRWKYSRDAWDRNIGGLKQFFCSH